MAAAAARRSAALSAVADGSSTIVDKHSCRVFGRFRPLEDGADEFAALDQKTIDVSTAIDQLFNFETKGIGNKKELLRKVLKVRFEMPEIQAIDSEEHLRLHIQ